MSIKQAIEALESCDPGDYSTGHVIHPSYDEEKVSAAIAALRSMPQVEPMAEFQAIYFQRNTGIDRIIVPATDNPGDHVEQSLITHIKLLYATPHTEAVRMSEAELNDAWNSAVEHSDPTAGNAHIRYGRAVEQATAARLGVKWGDV